MNSRKTTNMELCVFSSTVINCPIKQCTKRLKDKSPRKQCFNCSQEMFYPSPDYKVVLSITEGCGVGVCPHSYSLSECLHPGSVKVDGSLPLSTRRGMMLLWIDNLRGPWLCIKQVGRCYWGKEPKLQRVHCGSQWAGSSCQWSSQSLGQTFISQSMLLRKGFGEQQYKWISGRLYQTRHVQILEFYINDEFSKSSWKCTLW